MTKWRDIPWRERRWAVYSIVRQLQPNADTGSIWDEIERQHGEELALVSVYHMLDRLEANGFLRHESRRHTDPEQDAANQGKARLFWYATGKPRPVKTAPQSEGWEPGTVPA
jgi:hypothetical protein